MNLAAMEAGNLPLFYDSSNQANIASGARAALYVDGDYRVTVEEARRFTEVRWITVTGDGGRAGIIDYEPGNPCFDPPRLRGFVRARKAAGEWARIYVDRELAAEAERALFDSGAGQLLAYDRLEWWIPTLDNGVWTADELAADLRANYDCKIRADRIWANQFTDRRQLVDVSRLYRPW